MPSSSTELIVLILFGIAILLVPSLLAWAISSLIKADREVTAPSASRHHSPRRRNATRSRAATFSRRFPGR